MNDKTIKFLKSIRPPKEILKKLFYEKNTFLREREMAEDFSRNKHIPKKQREVIKRELEKGSFDRKSLEIRPEIAERIEKETEERIKDAIKTGKIPKPDLDNDDFARKIMKK